MQSAYAKTPIALRRLTCACLCVWRCAHAHELIEIAVDKYSHHLHPTSNSGASSFPPPSPGHRRRPCHVIIRCREYHNVTYKIPHAHQARGALRARCAHGVHIICRPLYTSNKSLAKCLPTLAARMLLDGGGWRRRTHSHSHSHTKKLRAM